jgi:hydroxyacylglutathione hydrolase
MRNWSTHSGYRIIQVLSGRSNVFLINNGLINILVDTSPAFMWKNLQKKLNLLNVKKIDLLILTHSHFDHAGNASSIREKYKTRVLINRSEAEYLTSGDNIPPTGTNLFSRFLVRNFIKQFEKTARYEPCTADVLADDGYELSEYGLNAYLMHTPGHTTGSMSVIIDNEIALVGDTMFGIFPGSVFPPFASDINQLFSSWKKLLTTECRLFIPSHGSANKRSLVEKDFKKRASSLININ